MAEQNANAGLDRGQVLHGARMWVAFNGVTLGYCANVNVQRNTQHMPVDVLDNLATEEHVPVSYGGTFNFAGIAVANKTFLERGVMIAFNDLITAPTKTVTLMDRPTDRAAWTLERCSISGDSFTAAKGQLMMLNFNGVFIYRKDANGVIC